jgi:hypothetical protein
LLGRMHPHGEQPSSTDGCPTSLGGRRCKPACQRLSPAVLSPKGANRNPGEGFARVSAAVSRVTGPPRRITVVQCVLDLVQTRTSNHAGGSRTRCRDPQSHRTMRQMCRDELSSVSANGASQANDVSVGVDDRALTSIVLAPGSRPIPWRRVCRSRLPWWIDSSKLNLGRVVLALWVVVSRSQRPGLPQGVNP